MNAAEEADFKEFLSQSLITFVEFKALEPSARAAIVASFKQSRGKLEWVAHHSRGRVLFFFVALSQKFSLRSTVSLNLVAFCFVVVVIIRACGCF